jgi:L-asparagine oxygenase
MIGIRNVVRRQGYIFLPEFEPHRSPKEVISNLGKISPVGDYDPVHELRPHACDNRANSYSGRFGFGKFPMHTDFAHWFIPPRYVALRCVVGAKYVQTLVFDSRSILKEVGEDTLQRGLVQPRIPLQGHRPLLRILDCEGSQVPIFRWDSIFLVPATHLGQLAVGAVMDCLKRGKPQEVTLEHPGDTLVVDNWRTLHARSVATKGPRRIIVRSYLSEIR